MNFVLRDVALQSFIDYLVITYNSCTSVPKKTLTQKSLLISKIYG